MRCLTGGRNKKPFLDTVGCNQGLKSCSCTSLRLPTPLQVTRLADSNNPADLAALVAASSGLGKLPPPLPLPPLLLQLRDCNLGALCFFAQFLQVTESQWTQVHTFVAEVCGSCLLNSTSSTWSWRSNCRTLEC